MEIHAGLANQYMGEHGLEFRTKNEIKFINLTINEI